MVGRDSGHYARLASLPLLMPANPEESYTMTLLAYEVSARTGAPVFLLSTTAVANAITTLKVGPLQSDRLSQPATFERDVRKFTKATPQWCLEQHADALTRLEQAGELFAQAENINRVSLPASGKKRLGVIVSGVSSTYLEELRSRNPDRYAEIAVLKIGQVYPLPRQLLRNFLAGLERLLVL